MYGVSDAYKTAMKEKVQHFRLWGYIGNVTFDDRNIMEGSFSITNQCSDGTDIMIGQVYAAELNVTLMGLNLPRYSISTLKIRPYFGLMLADGTYEDIPLGIFTPAEVNHGAVGVTIKAYDNMAQFDYDFPSNINMEGSLYDFAAYACNTCGVVLANKKAEFLAMCNGNYTFDLPKDHGITCYRDLIAWVAQCAASVATIGRDGKLYFKQYHTAVDDTISESARFKDATFSDFTTKYSGVGLVVKSLGTLLYVNADYASGGYTYSLGQNPFLQTKSLCEIQCKNIANILAGISYVPFESSGIGNPAYDLMDVIRFTGGNADSTRTSCITNWEFKYHGPYKMKGAGRNPALSSAQSRTDKNLIGILSGNTAHVVIDHVPTATDLSGTNGTIFLVIDGSVL